MPRRPSMRARRIASMGMTFLVVALTGMWASTESIAAVVNAPWTVRRERWSVMAENTRSIRRKKAVYETSSGEAVPGVTTVLNLRNKPALVEWAFKLGREHPELGSTRDYLDDLARIGTCAH